MLSFSQKVLTAELGKTHLFSVGQAGYIIKSAAGQLLGIDLYLSQCVERVEGNAGFKRLLPQILLPQDIVFDVLICTHPHMDHFDVDAVPDMLTNRHTKLLCSVDCKALVSKLHLGYYDAQITFVKPMESIDAGNFHMDFVNCDHGSGAPDAVGVVVTVDGKRIYETGDTCLRLDRLGELPKQLDVMIAPINGAYGNLSERECAELSEAIQPKLAIPCHYGMFASHHGDVGAFYDAMLSKKLPMLLMQQGECYTF